MISQRVEHIGGWSYAWQAGALMARATQALAVTIALLALAPGAAIAAGGVPSITGRVVGPDGQGIAEAVVFIESPPPAVPYSTALLGKMDQIDKTFVPGLLPIVVGTRVTFPNHDQIHHHVYSFSRVKTFELPLYKGEDAPPVLFDKPGVVKVGCNIHDWMSGIILVLPTPWFAQTDHDGRYEIMDVPHGTYQLAAWHERSKVKTEDTTRSVIVGATAIDSGFTLTLAPARARPAIRGSRREP